MYRRTLFIFAVSLLLPFVATAASFDCQKAHSEREKYICSHPIISQMDELLSAMYQRAHQYARDPVEVKKQQLDWWHISNDDCRAGAEPARCEAAYISAIAWLKKRYYADQQPLVSQPTQALAALIKGMQFPRESELDNTSKNALAAENYQPWPRRPLLHLAKGQSVAGLTAVYKNGTLYVYYAVSSDDKGGSLYELNMASNQTRLLFHAKYWTTLGQPLQVKKGLLFFVPGGNQQELRFPQNPEPQLMIYPVGSGEKPQPMTAQQQQRYSRILDAGNSFSVNEDGPWLAIYTAPLYYPTRYDIFHNLDGFRQRYDVRKQHSASAFVLYDRDNQVVQDPHISPGSSWNISGLVMARHQPYAYFANQGAVACIWQYDINRDEVSKIVPEHDARLPAPVSIDGHDFLVFTMKNQQGLPAIYLAVRPG
ncbi:lysozyme inhibitor LprI family protein [Gallaecimonas mangrovi]|uniref:lysozyme inhibitor LprI family protein n=1 Tax=Gallaecimonas mangrovi TaxID=2291597 RepID=UPI000E2067E8|nr:hypothetical protein [Gallaecimonas mangrovi]